MLKQGSSRLGTLLLWLALLLSILTNLALTSTAIRERVNGAIKHLGRRAEPAQKNTVVLGAADTQITDTVSLRNRYAYWQNIIQDHPDYRDGYYMAAILAYQLGNTDEARALLNKVKNLDPNFMDGTALETLIAGE